MAFEGPPPGGSRAGAEAARAVIDKAAGCGGEAQTTPHRRMTVRKPPADTAAVRSAQRLQRRRHWLQAGFFAFFVFAPALNLLRFDLNETQLWVLGMRWSLGIDAFTAGQISAPHLALNFVLRALLPALALVGGFLAVAWRWGRLWCGWLCPHFSAVELLNDLLHRACAKFSVWDRHALPRVDRPARKRWWPLFALSCLILGFTWAVTLLSYLLPPAEVWGGLLHGTSTPNQAKFLAIATTVFTLEFAFARHLFCRFGCAVGLFQSLVWMANPRGMVVAFSRERARDCRDCETVKAPSGSACDNACPMRLHPRNIKRMMFSCVQCGRCLSECDVSQGPLDKEPLLNWEQGEAAQRETQRQKREEG
ncbi:4Fe-4S binding protein [Azohydromonas lata]|uniref:4Fe-4S binding protein n=1 Tax=Azohydromonas lata TaxID=45677 RepID=UPI000AD97D75|nr:4Fe-4S binding protein [Azohydromonas lata]